METPYCIAVLVKETAAGVARVDGGASLNQRHGFAVQGDFTLQRTDDAIRCGAGERTQRVADGDRQTADGYLIHAAHADRTQAGLIDLDDRDIGLRVSRYQGRVIALAVV